MGNVIYSRSEFVKLFSMILEDYGDCMFASDFSALLSSLADFFESRHAVIFIDSLFLIDELNCSLFDV